MLIPEMEHEIAAVMPFFQNNVRTLQVQLKYLNHITERAQSGDVQAGNDLQELRSLQRLVTSQEDYLQTLSMRIQTAKHEQNKQTTAAAKAQVPTAPPSTPVEPPTGPAQTTPTTPRKRGRPRKAKAAE